MVKDFDESIYEMINDIDQNVDDYEEQTVSKEEIERWKKNIGNGTKSKKKNSTAIFVRCAVAAVILIVATAVFRNPAMAYVDLMTYHIQELMGNTNDLSSYSVAIDKVIANDGIMVSVGDVIADEDCLYITYTERFENGEKNIFVNPEVYINGIRVSHGSGGGMKTVEGEENTYVSMMRIDLNQKFDSPDKAIQYKLVFNYFDTEDDSIFSCGKIGEVSFIATPASLMKDKITVNIGKELTLPNGGTLLLDQYVSSPVNQKITVVQTKEGAENNGYDITLKGTDNLGREMMFYLESFGNNKGKLVLFYDGNESLADNSFDMSEVESFTVISYAQEYPEESGRMDTEMVQLSDEFVINIK